MLLQNLEHSGVIKFFGDRLAVMAGLSLLLCLFQALQSNRLTSINVYGITLYRQTSM